MLMNDGRDSFGEISKMKREFDFGAPPDGEDREKAAPRTIPSSAKHKHERSFCV